MGTKLCKFFGNEGLLRNSSLKKVMTGENWTFYSNLKKYCLFEVLHQLQRGAIFFWIEIESSSFQPTSYFSKAFSLMRLYIWNFGVTPTLPKIVHNFGIHQKVDFFTLIELLSLIFPFSHSSLTLYLLTPCLSLLTTVVHLSFSVGALAWLCGCSVSDGRRGGRGDERGRGWARTATDPRQTHPLAPHRYHHLAHPGTPHPRGVPQILRLCARM